MTTEQVLGVYRQLHRTSSNGRCYSKPPLLLFTHETSITCIELARCQTSAFTDGKPQLKVINTMKDYSFTAIEPEEARASRFGCNSNAEATSGLSSIILPDSFSDKRWFKTTSLLRADPSLMTAKILLVALKNHAPLHVIKFFLGLNPKSAGIPKEGPTPLQVAVQHNASKEVVKELIQACPFALIVTTSAEWLDPLSYARRFRSTETELIDLLSRPLGSWIHPKEKEEAELKASRKPKPKINIPIPTTTFPFGKTRSVEYKEKSTSSLSKADKHELQNVKALCLSIIKGQKKLVREIDKVKEGFEQNPFAGIDAGTDITPTPVVITPAKPQVTEQDVKDLEEKQKKNLRAHLIALDMKEQAMRAYVRRMEQRILTSLEATKEDYVVEQDSFSGLRNELQSTAHRMDDFIGGLEHRMADFEGRLARESKVNTSFRNGLEHHLGVTTDVSRQEGLEIVSIVENTPMVFATPYRAQKTEEDVPLFPREAARERHEQKPCLAWPRFLRRRDPHPTLN